MSDSYFHSVRLIEARCRGCVVCAKHCPMEAIRVRAGKARILEERCIDCGECIRLCPAKAKTTVTDAMDCLERFSYNVALPAPSLYAQFPATVSVGRILGGLLQLGFDAVCEVALGAADVTAAVKRLLQKKEIPKPLISSACPAVVRLVQVKFPDLLPCLVPMEAPVTVTARLARARAVEQTGLPPEKIGVWFLTPCPAKMTAVKQAGGVIDGAIAISHLYGELLAKVHDKDCPEVEVESSWLGAGWALAGGESQGVMQDSVLAVDGIEQVSQLLEQVAFGTLGQVRYIEALACAGGCIGGPLTAVNRFVGETQLRGRASIWPSKTPEKPRAVEVLPLPLPKPVLRLDQDIHEALRKVESMEEMLYKLPGLDCGSCGSPNCRALAEDIVQGQASETDCVFLLRQRVRDLAQEMKSLAEKLPPSLDKSEEES